MHISQKRRPGVFFFFFFFPSFLGAVEWLDDFIVWLFGLASSDQKYYPMEIDDTISDADKLPLMVKWWTSSHQLMIDAGLNRSHLVAACKSTSTYQPRAMLPPRPGHPLLFLPYWTSSCRPL